MTFPVFPRSAGLEPLVDADHVASVMSEYRVRGVRIGQKGSRRRYVLRHVNGTPVIALKRSRWDRAPILISAAALGAAKGRDRRVARRESAHARTWARDAAGVKGRVVRKVVTRYALIAGIQ